MRNTENGWHRDVFRRNDHRLPITSEDYRFGQVDSVSIMVGRWTNERLATAVVIIGCGVTIRVTPV